MSNKFRDKISRYSERVGMANQLRYTKPNLKRKLVLKQDKLLNVLIFRSFGLKLKMI